MAVFVVITTGLSRRQFDCESREGRLNRSKTMTQSVNNRWVFDLNRLQNSPSKRDGIGPHEELLLRQKGTNLIKEMSQELKLRPICMNTAIVYFHRFFTLRSFKRFDVSQISICSLFLSAKFEEQPIFKEHIIKLSFHCLRKELSDEIYRKECEKLVVNENEMLLTFGFDLSVIHFQTVICSASDPNVINKTIQRNAYVIAGDLLRMSTICVQLPPSFAACVCIYLSSTLLNLPISATNWCQTIDKTLNQMDIETEAQQFKCFINRSKLSVDEKKRKHTFDPSISPESAYSSGSSGSPLFDDQPKSNINWTENNKTKQKLNNNNSFGQMIPNHNKRIKTEHNSTLGISAVKFKTNTNSLANSHNLIKTKVLPNIKSAVRADNIVDTNAPIFSRIKFLNVVKPNVKVDELVPHNKPSAQVSVKPTPKTIKNINSSSTAKASTHSKATIGTNFSAKKGFQKLNLKITFSTNDSNKSDSNKRVVEPVAQKIKSNIKIES